MQLELGDVGWRTDGVSWVQLVESAMARLPLGVVDQAGGPPDLDLGLSHMRYGIVLLVRVCPRCREATCMHW